VNFYFLVAEYMPNTHYTEREYYTVGMKVTYSCDVGFINEDGTEDPTVLTCLPDGSWSGSPPKCLGKLWGTGC